MGTPLSIVVLLIGFLKSLLWLQFIEPIESYLLPFLDPNNLNIASRLQAYPASNGHHPPDLLAMLGPLMGCGWLRPRGGQRRRSP
jgi:hypothetical protein